MLELSTGKRKKRRTLRGKMRMRRRRRSEDT
jgi:hypothetical protein